jgi:hypothetical protein
MAMIVVPAPTLQFDAAAPGLATLEKPVTVVSKAVALPDGTAVSDQLVPLTAGFFLYRQSPSSAAAQIWNPDQKLWQTATDSLAATLKPKPLAYQKDQPAWQGVFVAAGEKGAVEAGVNSYSFRTWFQAPFAGSIISGLSAPSPGLRFVAAVDAAQAGVKLQSPETATEIQIFLRDSNKQLIGSIRLSNESGHARIEISNSVGAAVRITPQGDIEIQPASGHNIVLQGPLMAQNINYLPRGGGSAQWL